jgi:16S rRNA (guanine(966)-N(2))-methyltransferase RsmD
MSLKQDSAKKLRKEKRKWRVTSWEDFEKMEDAFLKERLLSKEPTIAGQVRITAGKAKNFLLDIPKTTRPMTDRMKVRVFDVLREDIYDKRVLDLYAGTGSFGLEALSRGAKEATFVDASKNAERILQSNVTKTGFLPKSEIVKMKSLDYLNRAVKEERTFDVVFLDPPYKLFNTKKTFKMREILVLALSLLPGILNPKTKQFKGAMIVKHPRRYPIETLNLEGIERICSYDFGLSTVSFYIVKQK